MSFSQRRQKLLGQLKNPTLLFAGNALARNYAANTFPYRADSNFLYFFGDTEAGSAALFDPAEGRVSLFLPRRTVEDALWHGQLDSFEKIQRAKKVDEVLAIEDLTEKLGERVGRRTLDSLAVADPRTTARARKLTGQDLSFEDGNRIGKPELVDAIFELRARKQPEEIEAMRATASATLRGHLEAMRASAPGVREEYLAGLVEGAFARYGCVPAYQTILSVRGEVLHNHAHDNTLQAGDIVLLDAGAEGKTGHCSDVTRCWPVGNDGFSPEGRDIYELVLEAQLAAIAMVKPGVRYRDVHLASCRVLAKGLAQLGLIKGDSDAAVESGAHAIFFPHGIGHQIGIDVHDMESFGDRVHYPGRERSKQFGTKYLRMDRELEAGYCVTIEPGIYFVPAILQSPELRAQFAGQVDFAKAERYLEMNSGRGFGGIRIEDDVLCTETGPVVLTAAIPKQRDEIESLVGTARAG